LPPESYVIKLECIRFDKDLAFIAFFLDICIGNRKQYGFGSGTAMHGRVFTPATNDSRLCESRATRIPASIFQNLQPSL
jgi:hypothetical protein